MAKKIRFPLKINGADVRTIEELRENFDLEGVLGYFANGKLVIWLRDRYYNGEADAIENLSSADEKLSKKICSILKVEYSEEVSDIDIESVKRRNEKIALLKQLDESEQLIAKVDAVAFNQDDLLDILDTGTEKMIYLCQGDFEVPLTIKNITYVGIDNPSVLLRAYDNVDFSSLNLKFVDIYYGWDTSSVSSADNLYQAENLFNLGKYDESIKMLENLVRTDNPRACWLLRVILYFVKNESDRAYNLGKKTFDLGDIIACNNYISASQIAKINLRTLERLSEKGDAIATNTIGCVYSRKGEGKKIQYYKKAIEQGYFLSEFNLGDCYYNGDGVEQDLTLAAKWYEKAAERGHKFAQNSIGDCYYYGNGVEENNEKAVYWYKKAAESGVADACESLAKCYSNGYGVKQDYQKSIEWRRKGAELGAIWSIANLGWHYRYGKGVDQDYQTALEWYKKASELGNAYAQKNLADLYYNGYGVDVDYHEAAKWYLKAAEGGNSNAQESIAYCYQLGNGVEQDYQKSIEWRRKGADNGNNTCISNLGWHYQYGKGVTQDYGKAFEYYKKASDNGDDWAKNKLGEFYENGYGVAVNIQEAIKWYREAAKLGNEDAKASLERLGESL
ncbi:hypothetical protein [Ruminococcus callidus]|uniref:SEL1-like repeat protein n=1 Tax=Ruminococcus callidus TaxID=40519 RepID=UPI0039A0F392